jgi:hypothetical protein
LFRTVLLSCSCSVPCCYPAVVPYRVVILQAEAATRISKITNLNNALAMLKQVTLFLVFSGFFFGSFVCGSEAFTRLSKITNLNYALAIKAGDNSVVEVLAVDSFFALFKL